MKKWKCEVCGYIHEGSEAIDSCPVCGASKDKFSEIILPAGQTTDNIPKTSNVFATMETSDSAVKKVPAMNTGELSFDTYYFKTDQVLSYHRHPTGDQIFIFFKGNGIFYIDDGVEQTIDVGPGSIVLAPKNVWHKVINTGNGELIASQATKQPAGMEAREV